LTAACGKVIFPGLKFCSTSSIEGKAPKLAVGDGAPGFWKALEKVYASTRWRRCRVHKTANVLNKLSMSLQAKAKEKLHQIGVAPDKAEAGDHFDDFIEIYKAK